MPKIRVTKTTPVAVDGIHIRKFAEGWEGEVNDSVAKILVDDCHAAVRVRERMAPAVQPDVGPSENAVMEDVPEKKLVDIQESNVSTIIRVWQLSDELGVASKRIIEIAKNLKIDVAVPASGLSFEEADKIRAELEKPKR